MKDQYDLGLGPAPEKTDFEKVLEGQEKEVTTKEMDGDEINHFNRPITITFPQRQQALEAWSAVKKILETFQVEPTTGAIMMESMNTLAVAIDADIQLELKEKEDAKSGTDVHTFAGTAGEVIGTEGQQESPEGIPANP